MKGGSGLLCSSSGWIAGGVFSGAKVVALTTICGVEPTLTTDVLITGGGPCGLMLVIDLGRRGVRCLLVNDRLDTAFNPQANATQARTMEHFRRLGFAPKVRQQGLPADHPTDIAYLTHFAGRELARLRLPTAAAATQLVKRSTGPWSAAELAHRVSQKLVEKTLLEEARKLPSVDLRFGWRMKSFADHGSHVEATVAPAHSQATDAHTAFAGNPGNRHPGAVTVQALSRCGRNTWWAPTARAAACAAL